MTAHRPRPCGLRAAARGVLLAGAGLAALSPLLSHAQRVAAEGALTVAELDAARAAWEAGSADAALAERLITQWRAAGQPLQAIALGEQAYQRLGGTRWLLLAMDTAVASRQHDALRRLLGVAAREQARFAGSAMYWLIVAHDAAQGDDRAAARAAYDRALALEPASVSTRAQVLWFEINGRDIAHLERRLQQWLPDAAAEPALWMPYAVGLVKIGRPDDSVIWYERQVKAAPGDIPWRLSYAFVLSEAGRPELAQRLRREIYQQLKTMPGYVDSLPPAERPELMLTQARLAQEVDGAEAATRILQDMLARGDRRADVYSQLVAARLSQGDAEGAHGWMLQSAAEGHTLPAYQVLAIASSRRDRVMLETLLRERSEDLIVTDRVLALRRLGRPAEALELIDRQTPGASSEAARQLQQLRDDIQREQARHLEARLDIRNIGELDLRQQAITGSQPLADGRATMRLAHNTLKAAEDGTLVAFSQQETDLSWVADLTADGDPLTLTLGTSLRPHASLVYGGAVWERGLGASLRARVAALVNGLTEESAAMRALGRKSRLSVGLSGQPSALTYARVEIAAQRFETRQGDALGHGLRLEGEAGAVLRQASPRWQVRLSGSVDRNQLEASLPASLSGTGLSPFATVESLLAPRFSTLGVGSTLRFGAAQGLGRESHGFVDVWLGRQWPANEIAYSLRLGASVPVQTAGTVELEAHHINVQNGVTGSGKSTQGVALGYRHAF